ncbi:hypothetical protein [Yersinia aleksiciae]|uniref:Uncharacterized protein n=1 Tax=Yersinia aleksiciae TaxID=263819 RepID=A0A0T9TFT1_YERAE|nr:hypothetical protein [Yersinia aleksiciae]CNK80248.1 Uncharacterised protein [Yersinia aleksiciae]
MKKQRVTMLWGLLFCGMLALSMTQAAPAAEIKEGHFPYDFCFTCTHPIWG